MLVYVHSLMAETNGWSVPESWKPLQTEITRVLLLVGVLSTTDSPSLKKGGKGMKPMKKWMLWGRKM